MAGDNQESTETAKQSVVLFCALPETKPFPTLPRDKHQPEILRDVCLHSCTSSIFEYIIYLFYIISYKLVYLNMYILYIKNCFGSFAKFTLTLFL